MPSTPAFLALLAAAAAAPLPTHKVCVADRAQWDALFWAISYVCGPQTGVDCTPINAGGARFLPNNIYAHDDYAFQQYYKLHGSCEIGTPSASYLVDCIAKGVTCRAAPGATDAALQQNIAYICSSDRFASRCAPIQPGGARHRQTVAQQADWAMDMYYQTYRCAQPDTACDFNGTAHVVYANATAPTPAPATPSPGAAAPTCKPCVEGDVCCNPHTEVPQRCPGTLEMCCDCGADACACPAPQGLTILRGERQ